RRDLDHPQFLAEVRREIPQVEANLADQALLVTLCPDRHQHADERPDHEKEHPPHGNLTVPTVLGVSPQGAGRLLQGGEAAAVGRDRGGKLGAGPGQEVRVWRSLQSGSRSHMSKLLAVVAEPGANFLDFMSRCRRLRTLRTFGQNSLESL